MNLKVMGAALLLGLSAAPGLAAPDAEPIVTKSGPLGQPKAGMAQVVFFRPGSMIGAALGCTVHEANNQVARLGSGKYYVIDAAPGKHQYFTQGEVTDRLNLEVEDGETYFVKCNIGMGIASGRANLSPSDRDTFAHKAKGLKMWAPKEDANSAAATPTAAG